MKRQSRLSLNRNGSGPQLSQNTHIDLIEISDDDDSIDLSPNIWKSTEEYTNVISHGTTSILNSMTDTSKYNSKHDISDDLSDEDIIVDNVPNNDTSYKNQSMFNWNKSTFDPLNMFPECSTSYECSGWRKKVIEAPNKRRKLMRNNSKSSDLSYSEDEINFNFPKKDDSPPQVGIQHDIMIAGTRVKLPVKPYSCQITVMNKVSMII